MGEIIAAVAQRTGLPPDKARAAVEAIIEHLKGRLPTAISSQIEGILGGGDTGGAGTPGGGLGGLAGELDELGGLFAKK